MAFQFVGVKQCITAAVVHEKYGDWRDALNMLRVIPDKSSGELREFDLSKNYHLIETPVQRKICDEKRPAVYVQCKAHAHDNSKAGQVCMAKWQIFRCEREFIKTHFDEAFAFEEGFVFYQRGSSILTCVSCPPF